jgi:hypothetical protein
MVSFIHKQHMGLKYMQSVGRFSSFFHSCAECFTFAYAVYDFDDS